MRPKCSAVAMMIMIIFILFTYAFCQTKCDHTSLKSFYSEARFMPITLIHKDTSSLEVIFHDKYGSELSAYTVIKETQINGVKLGERAILIYCDTHKVAYSLVPLDRK